MNIPTCQHQIALCKLKNCTACNYNANTELCPFAHNESVDECTPTFRQALDFYRHHSGASFNHILNVETIVKKDIGRVGLTLDSKTSEMSRPKFKTLIQILSSPMGDGKVLHGSTIRSHLDAFRSLSSERLESRYEDAGLTLPSFSIPKFVPNQVPVQEISDSTIRKVEVEMERCLSNGRQSDRDVFVACFFGLYCGMRAGDVSNIKWDVIKHTNIGVMIDYIPHKSITPSCPQGRRVSFVLPNRIYCKIEPLMGRPEEYVLPRYPHRAAAHVKQGGGQYIGKHVSLWNRVNRILSDCGIGNDFPGQKKFHALRKYFETNECYENGAAIAASKCGHTVAVQQKYYRGSLAGKAA